MSNVNAVQYFKKNSTTEKIQRRLKAKITTKHEDKMIIYEAK